MTEETQGNTQAPEGPQFALQRIYVKDLSFETPNSPQIFLEQWHSWWKSSRQAFS